jgi:KTSC domain
MAYCIRYGMPSSVIKTFNYNDSSNTLRIVYVSGAVYEYLGVPVSEYEAMKAAKSKGKHLNLKIKPGYAYRKIC